MDKVLRASFALQSWTAQADSRPGSDFWHRAGQGRAEQGRAGQGRVGTPQSTRQAQHTVQCLCVREAAGRPDGPGLQLGLNCWELFSSLVKVSSIQHIHVAVGQRLGSEKGREQ